MPCNEPFNYFSILFPFFFHSFSNEPLHCAMYPHDVMIIHSFVIAMPSSSAQTIVVDRGQTNVCLPTM